MQGREAMLLVLELFCISIWQPAFMWFLKTWFQRIFQNNAMYNFKPNYDPALLQEHIWLYTTWWCLHIKCTSFWRRIPCTFTPLWYFKTLLQPHPGPIIRTELIIQYPVMLGQWVDKLYLCGSGELKKKLLFAHIFYVKPKIHVKFSSCLEGGWGLVWANFIL